MSRYAFLNSQDSFSDLTAAIFHDRRLPIRVRFPQVFNQASGKSQFGQGRFESVFLFQLFALLRGQISFEKNIARIVLLRRKNTDETRRRRSHGGEANRKAECTDQSKQKAAHFSPSPLHWDLVLLGIESSGKGSTDPRFRRDHGEKR